MKRNKTNLYQLWGILLMSAIFGLSSCQNKTKHVEVSINSMQLDTVVLLDEHNPKSPSYEINLYVNYLKAPATDTVATRINREIMQLIQPNMSETVSINDFPKKVIDDIATDYRSEVLALYKADKESSDDKQNASWYNWYLTYKLEIQEGKKGIYSCLLSTDMFTGGAHPNRGYTTLNLDVKTGKPLKKEDVFLPNTDRAVAEVILPYLIKEVNKRLETDTISTTEGLRENGVLLDGDLTPAENFQLLDSGVNFIYNTYEIAPYAMGEFAIIVPYEKLANYLKLK